MRSFRIEGAVLVVNLEAAPAELTPALQRSRPDWEAAGWLSGDTLRLPYEHWVASGQPTYATDEPLEADYWRRQWAVYHDLLCSLVGIRKQAIAFGMVGFFGARGSRLEMSIDGRPAQTGASDFSRWGAGDSLVARAPLTEWLACRVREFPEGDRMGQLGLWAQLRAAVEELPPLLQTPVEVALAPFLKEIEPQRPERFSLEWETAGRDGSLATLATHIVDEEGHRKRVSYGDFDPRGYIVTDAKRPVLLPPDVARVMDAARSRDRKPRRTVEAEIADPTRVLPEGVEVDRYFDLSHYSDRVAGFELVQRRDPRPTGSSGIRWFDANEDLRATFARLFGEDATTGERREFVVSTPDDARRLLEENEKALESRASKLTSIAVRPSPGIRLQLENHLRFLPSHREMRPEEQAPQPQGTYAAIPKDLEACERDLDGPVVDEGRVPWAALESMMLPGRTLKTHQRRGIAWLWQHLEKGTPGVLLADDMGLGKTLQAAAFLVLRSQQVPAARHLIICPTVLLENWLKEISFFFKPEAFKSIYILHAENLRRLVRHGALDVSRLKDEHLVVTNYDTLARHQKSLLTLDFDVVLFDEAQHIKNADTLRARAARTLKRGFAVALTGTPVENILTDVWAIYDAIQTKPERAFGDRPSFEQSYTMLGSAGIQAVRNRLRFPSVQSSLLRREKSEALRDLPPKNQVVRRAEMCTAQVELEGKIQEHAKRAGALAALQALRQLYQHPLLLSARAPTLSAKDVLDFSPKTQLCLDILEEIKAKGEKALVFVLSLRMQDVLAELFGQRFGLPRVNIINGDPARRAAALRSIEDFGSRPGFNVLLLSPIAAGVGLTITQANHVIHYERWWNPAKEDQATDRAYRIGQTKPVTVYYPILHRPGDPNAGFDVRLHELVERKRNVARDFLAPVDGLELSKSEVVRMFEEERK